MDEILYFEDIHVEINADSLIDRVKLRNSSRSREDFYWAVETAKELIHPRAIVGVGSISCIDDTTVRIEDQEFTSRILRVNLDPYSVAYPFIATIGPELENIAAKQDKLTRKFFLELVGDYSLINSVMQIEEEIKKKFNIKRISSMSPGEIQNWGLSEQTPLFKLFRNHLSQIGVNLTSSLMMKPRKSRSGIVFENETGYINCQFCVMDRCPGRRAKYNPNKYAEYDLPIPQTTDTKTH